MISMNLSRPFVQLAGRVDLNLGGGEGTGLVIAGQLPPLTGSVRMRRAVTVTIAGVLPAPGGAVLLEPERSVYRGVQAGAGSAWQAGAACGAQVQAAAQDGVGVHAATGAGWAAGQGADRAHLEHYALRLPLTTNRAAGWQAGAPRPATAQETWRDRAPVPAHAGNGWQRTAPVAAGAGQGHQDRVPVPAARRARWQRGQALGDALLQHGGAGRPVPAGGRSRWQYGDGVGGWGGPIVIIVPPEPPEEGCAAHPIGFVQLQLLKPATGDRTQLNLRCQGTTGTIIVPVRRVYMSINQIEVVTLPARTALDVLDLDISIDVDTWAWQVTGTLPAAQQELVARSGGAPVEIEVTVNGVQWVFVIDKPTRSRVFGRARTRFTGRSRAAYLADPFDVPVNRSNTAPATAQQLILDALPPDWSLLWQASDWLVPAGAWSHRGTAIDVATTVVGAIRGQVHAHRVDKQLRVSARYPIAPWEWAAATPDITLPISVVTSEDTEWQELPPYNRVFVAGTAHGVLAQVTRDGTAGDVLAEMATDALITDDIAARQRGIAELARGGRQAMVSIDVPLIPTDGLGLIECGRLLQVVEGADAWTGMVRGVQVQPSRTKTRQRLRVERRIA